MELKIIIKQIFIKTKTLFIYDRLVFLAMKIKFASSNKNFRKNHPEFILPPDYYLYETYKLDYKGYHDSGKVAAKEMLDWTKVYVAKPKRILEWGCGVSRVIKHLPELTDDKSEIFGVDINETMIEWNKKNIENVTFQKTDYYPPLPFQDKLFDLVFALSVFTHIEVELQENWLEEIGRIIATKGIFVFSTMGKSKEKYLTAKEKKIIEEKGSFTIEYTQKGHRLMGAYNRYDAFRELVEKHFEVLEFYDNENYPEKTGGQDLWIVQKK